MRWEEAQKTNRPNFQGQAPLLTRYVALSHFTALGLTFPAVKRKGRPRFSKSGRKSINACKAASTALATESTHVHVLPSLPKGRLIIESRRYTLKRQKLLQKFPLK